MHCDYASAEECALHTRTMRARHAASLLAGFVLLGVAAAHSLEDFAYRAPEQRFGVDIAPAAVLGGAGFALQAAALLAASRGWRAGYLANALIGAGWLLAAALDHLGELATAEDYRAGLLSKGLEVGVMAAGLALALTSLLALRTGSPDRG